MLDESTRGVPYFAPTKIDRTYYSFALCTNTILIVYWFCIANFKFYVLSVHHLRDVCTLRIVYGVYSIYCVHYIVVLILVLTNLTGPAIRRITVYCLQTLRMQFTFVWHSTDVIKLVYVNVCLLDWTLNRVYSI